MKSAIQALELQMATLEMSGEQIRERAQKLFRHIRNLHQAGHQLVRFADLASAPSLTWFALGDKVSAMHIPSARPTSNVLLYMVRFQVGAKLTWHYHDCFESLTVIDGQLLASSPRREIDRQLVIQPYEQHEFHSPSGALVHLELYR